MNRAIARLAGVLTAAFLLVVPTLVLAATWNIDPDHTSVEFKVRHLMVSNVKGVFGKVSGVVIVDERDITKSKVTATIDTTSIDTGVAKRDDHLRSADFLEVAKYPTMTFVSTGIASAGAGKLKVTGDLTLHGVTRSVVLDVHGPTQEIKDPWGNARIGATAAAKINRSDFGLTWNKALETGGVVVGDEVIITIEVELIKVK